MGGGRNVMFRSNPRHAFYGTESPPAVRPADKLSNAIVSSSVPPFGSMATVGQGRVQGAHTDLCRQNCARR